MNNLCFMTNLSSSEVAAWVQAVGSILAIAVAIWVFKRQNAHAENLALTREKDEEQHVLRSLRDEIKLTVDAFEEESGKRIREGADGAPHMWTNPVAERPFVIYDAYVNRLGKVADDELRRLIVLGYGRAQAIVYTIRYNNVLIERYVHARYLASVFKDETHKNLESGALYQLSAYGDTLRSSYKKTLLCIDEMIAALDRNIASK